MQIHRNVIKSERCTSAKVRFLTWAGGLFSLSLMLCMIASSPRVLLYDEPFHLSLVGDILKQGWINALVDPENRSAAGPLYPIIHIAVGEITNYSAPAVRWVNALLLLGVIFCVAFTRSDMEMNTPPLYAGALSMLGVPFLWPSAGMALTELPALAFFSAFVLCFRQLFITSSGVEKPTAALLMAVISGLCLGLAILGRQTYLVAIPVMLVLMILRSVHPRYIAISIFTAAVVSTWIFIVWQGLVPPSLGTVDSSLKWRHGLFALGYAATATIVISPIGLKPKDYPEAIIALLLGCTLTIIARDYSEPPAKTVIIHLFGYKVGLAFGFALFALMTALGLLWLWNTCMELWKRRADAFQLFSRLLLLALVVSPVKVSHLFSSRYIVGLLGILIIVLQPKPSAFLAVRIVVGSLLGAAILYHYYNP